MLCYEYHYTKSVYTEVISRQLPQRYSSQTLQAGAWLTFSRSGSRRARASSLWSMPEAAATSRGVDPLIAGEANSNEKEIMSGFCWN